MTMTSPHEALTGGQWAAILDHCVNAYGADREAVTLWKPPGQAYVDDWTGDLVEAVQTWEAGKYPGTPDAVGSVDVCYDGRHSAIFGLNQDGTVSLWAD